MSLLLPSLQVRTAVIAHLKARGLLAVFHYLPLHRSDMGRRFGGRETDCPMSEDISDRLLRLAFYNSLTVAEQSQVVDAVRGFRGYPAFHRPVRALVQPREKRPGQKVPLARKMQPSAQPANQP